MAQPTLVHSHPPPPPTTDHTNPSTPRTSKPHLPPPSAYAFHNLLSSASAANPSLQTALDGIARLAANNRMALADEYASHLPPLGEITATSPALVVGRTGSLGRPKGLTTVEEGSEGSGRGSLPDLGCVQGVVETVVVGRVRIGGGGWRVLVSGTTALAREGKVEGVRSFGGDGEDGGLARRSLRRLLAAGDG